MDLIKLEIDGRRVIADNRQTILEVARANGIDTIPTLCHDGQLEPFASCFVCVVKVKGARTLLPACSTKVGAGMVVETDNPEVRRSRKAALELMLSNHYADCVGPCQLACPAGVDIQGYIALATLGKYKDAIQLIKDANPLPAICGRVCTRPCEVTGCRRNLLDEPVGIDFIKRYIADLDLGSRNGFRPECAPPNGMKVAVVGGGPAGLSCSYYLALKGYQVQIFEALPEAGGMLRYGIPAYRLPKDVLDLEVNLILDLGVKLATNVSLGKDFTISSLKEEGYAAVFLGIGAWKSAMMRVQDEDADGVLPGIDFLRTFALGRQPELHGTVLVVGGGNTAIDCARTAIRLGAMEVKLLYRRTRKEMPANDVEIEEAAREGVAMEFLTAPVRVLKRDREAAALECIRMELGEPDASGRRSPKPIRGSEFSIDCDSVIAAIGQDTRVQEMLSGSLPNFLPFGEVLNLTRWRTVQVNPETFETSVEGVFSGGDVVTGAATAIEAIAAGRRAAYSIDRYLQTGKAEPEPFQFHSRKDLFRQVTVEDLPKGETYGRRPMPMLPEDERVSTFEEVEQGYTAEDMRKESHRCLECGCDALFECDLRKHATDYRVDIESFLGEAKQYRVDHSHPLIVLDPNKCILCGRCIRVCSEVVGVSAYGFINRGFDTVVKPALGGRLIDTECVSCGLCVATCPTGAISQKLPLAKPGPWRTEPTATICHYCGVGCALNYESFGDSLVKVSRYEGESVTYANHCKKGRFGFNYVQSPERLMKPMIRSGRELQETALDEAIRYTGMRLRELVRRHSGSEFAVFLSPRLTNEEIYLGQKLARIGMKTHNVTSLAHVVNRDLFCPDVVSTASYRDLVDAQAIVVVNSNMDEESFVADLLCKKAIRKGGKLIYIGPEENRVSRFAEVFLRCKRGTQTQVVLGLAKKLASGKGAFLGDRPALQQIVSDFSMEKIVEATGVRREDLVKAGDILAGSILKVLAFNKDYRGLRVARDERLLAESGAAMGCSVLSLSEKSNRQGLLDMGADPDWLPGYVSVRDRTAIEELEREWCVSLQDLRCDNGEIADLLRGKKLRVALVLGEDPFGAPGYPREFLDGLSAADFLVVADLFRTATMRLANVALPLASYAETSGTVTNSERRIQRIQRAIPPIAGVESWRLICEIASEMGYRFKMKYGGIEEVMEEIGRVVPIYRHGLAGTPDGESIWDLGQFGLRRGELYDPACSEPVTPVETLMLDNLENRFACWFDGTFAAARRAMENDPRPGIGSAT